MSQPARCAREFFTVLVNDLAGGNGANKLLPGVRILTLNQALVLLAGDFAFQVPFLGQLAAPAALNFACFAVVIILGVGVLLPVIIECCSTEIGAGLIVIMA